MDIFGGLEGRPWDENDWIASDDSVRGGRSFSRMTVLHRTTLVGSGSGEQQHGGDDMAVEFSGNLDTTALGGAGFASQRTKVFVGDGGSVPPLDLRGWDALVLMVGGVGVGDGGEKKFTVVLKDTILPRRPDGRETSGVSWECDFDVGEFMEYEREKKEKKIVLPFEKFKATYRGKPVEGGTEPLDWGCVRRVGIMMRSFFGEQQGPFSLVISSIRAEKLG